MKRPVVHVVGAGAAGLSTARALLDARSCDVVLHEAQAHPGGRRRSFHDASLALDFDTGAFPLLSCWTSTLKLIDAAGARGEWRAEAKPGVAFADFATGERWRLTPNAGRWPWWLLDARRRGPRLKLADYWVARRLLNAPPEATVASVAPQALAMERLWRPLTLAALNCPPEAASARLLAAVFREIVRAGGRGLRVLTPKRGFGRAFVEPVARSLARDGRACASAGGSSASPAIVGGSRASTSSTTASISDRATRRSSQRRGGQRRRSRRARPRPRRRARL